MFKITIPAPCHQDWNGMIVNEQGRHCNACSKTVIDFTSMNDDELRNFFLQKKEETTCGKFRNKQLSQTPVELPANILRTRFPIWKRFLVAGLIVFGSTLFSCNTKIKDNIEDLIVTKAASVINLKDSSNITIGVILPPPGSTKIKDSVCTIGKVIPEISDSVFIGTPLIVTDPDSANTISAEAALKADTIAEPVNFIPKPDALQTKNPPGADSTKTNCDSTQIIYS